MILEKGKWRHTTYCINFFANTMTQEARILFEHLHKTLIKAYTQFVYFYQMNETYTHINDAWRISVRALELFPVKEGTEKLM